MKLLLAKGADTTLTLDHPGGRFTAMGSGVIQKVTIIEAARLSLTQMGMFMPDRAVFIQECIQLLEDHAASV